VLDWKLPLFLFTMAYKGIKNIKIVVVNRRVGLDSSVGKATGYELDVPGSNPARSSGNGHCPA
jgi:hypothetical protein